MPRTYTTPPAFFDVVSQAPVGLVTKHTDTWGAQDDIGRPHRNAGLIRSARGWLVLEPRAPFDFAWADIEPHLDRIPPIEADILTLRFRDELKIREISKLFKRSSMSTVPYLIARAIKRIHFLLALPRISLDQFAAVVKTIAPREVELCLTLARTTCHRETAHRHRTHRRAVIDRHNAVIDLLADAEKREPLRYGPALKLLVAVRENPRILHEYRQPAFRRNA